MAEQKVHVQNKMAYLDRDIATEMGKVLLSNPKMDTAYAQIAAGNNPEGATAALLSQAALGVRDKMIQHGMLSNDVIWAAENGVLDNMIQHTNDVLKSEFGIQVDPQKTREAAIDIFRQFDAAGKQSRQGGQQQPQQGQAPQPQPQPDGMTPVPTPEMPMQPGGMALKPKLGPTL